MNKIFFSILSCPTDSDGTHISIIKNPIKTENPELRTKCFFDIQIDETKQKIGRIVFELYSDYVPRTCANFEQLCLGTNGLSYKYFSLFISLYYSKILLFEYSTPY